MSGTTPAPGASARNRRDKAEETTKTARALIDAERETARRKTIRLREARVAKEAEDAEAAALAKPKPKRRRKADQG
jgi:hypothetical protein